VTRYHSIRRFVTAASAAAATALAWSAGATEPPDHLGWAKLLVDTIDPAQNVYDSNPAYVYWQGYDGHGVSENRSKCSSFMTKLLERAYDFNFVSWMGCSSPIADRYYDTIVDQNGFTVVGTVSSVGAGDLIAIRNSDAGCYDLTCSNFQGCSSSGHVALVASSPIRRSSTSPVISGTTQYAVTVVDSSASYHGSTDTRYRAESDGSDDSGVGRGVMRLYANSNGNVVGHTWSSFSNSAYYAQSTRPLVVGRLVP
jgi:hypothetical protein